MNIINGLRHQVDGMIGSELERKVKEATSDQNWNASSSLKNEISEATYHYEGFNQVLPIVWKRLGESGPNWRMVFKALVLLEHLVISGSEKVVTEARDAIYQIRSLQNFRYTDEDGRNRGQGVVDMSRKILDLLEDDQRLREERQKAKVMRDRLSGVATTGFGSSAGGGRYTGFSGGSAASRGAQYESRRSPPDGAYGGRIDEASHDLGRHANQKIPKNKSRKKKRSKKRRETSEDEPEEDTTIPAPSGSDSGSDSTPTRPRSKKGQKKRTKNRKKSSAKTDVPSSRDLAFSEDDEPALATLQPPPSTSGLSSSGAAAGPDWGAFDNGDGWGDFEDGRAATSTGNPRSAPASVMPTDDLASAFADVNLTGGRSVEPQDDSWGAFGGPAAPADATTSADTLFAGVPSPAPPSHAPLPSAPATYSGALDPFGDPFAPMTADVVSQPLALIDDALFSNAAPAESTAPPAVAPTTGLRTAMGGGTSHIKSSSRTVPPSAPQASAGTTSNPPVGSSAVASDAWSKGSGLIDLSSLSKPSFAAFDPNKPASMRQQPMESGVHVVAVNAPLPSLGGPPLFGPGAGPALAGSTFNSWGATAPVVPPIGSLQPRPGNWLPNTASRLQQASLPGGAEQAGWPAGTGLGVQPASGYPSSHPFNM